MYTPTDKGFPLRGLNDSGPLKKIPICPKSDCQFQNGAGDKEEGMSPLCLPLGSQLVTGRCWTFTLSCSTWPPEEGQGKAKGRSHTGTRRNLWLCVCGVCTPGGQGPCVCLEVKAHTKMEACVCGVSLGVGGRGDSLRCSRTQLPFLQPQVCKARPSSMVTERGMWPGEGTRVSEADACSLHSGP